MKKILDPKNLPYFGAIVQAVLFSIAGNKFFASFGWLFGLGVGAVVNWSMAIASSRVSDIAKTRKSLAYLSLIFLFCLSPVIICSTLGWSIANFSWSVASDLSILLTGAIVGKSLVADRQPKQPAVKRTKPAKASTEPEVAEVKPTYPCSCGLSFGSQAALNAHQRKHKRIIGYTASFEPVTEEKVTIQKGEKP